MKKDGLKPEVLDMKETDPAPEMVEDTKPTPTFKTLDNKSVRIISSMGLEGVNFWHKNVPRAEKRKSKKIKPKMNVSEKEVTDDKKLNEEYKKKYFILYKKLKLKDDERKREIINALKLKNFSHDCNELKNEPQVLLSEDTLDVLENMVTSKKDDYISFLQQVKNFTNLSEPFTFLKEMLQIGETVLKEELAEEEEKEVIEEKNTENTKEDTEAELAQKEKAKNKRLALNNLKQNPEEFIKDTVGRIAFLKFILKFKTFLTNTRNSLTLMREAKNSLFSIVEVLNRAVRVIQGLGGRDEKWTPMFPPPIYVQSELCKATNSANLLRVTRDSYPLLASTNVKIGKIDNEELKKVCPKGNVLQLLHVFVNLANSEEENVKKSFSNFQNIDLMLSKSKEDDWEKFKAAKNEKINNLVEELKEISKSLKKLKQLKSIPEKILTCIVEYEKEIFSLQDEVNKLLEEYTQIAVQVLEKKDKDDKNENVAEFSEVLGRLKQIEQAWYSTRKLSEDHKKLFNILKNAAENNEVDKVFTKAYREKEQKQDEQISGGYMPNFYGCVSKEYKQIKL